MNYLGSIIIATVLATSPVGADTVCGYYHKPQVEAVESDMVEIAIPGTPTLSYIYDLVAPVARLSPLAPGRYCVTGTLKRRRGLARHFALGEISRIERLEDPEGWVPGEYAAALSNIDATRAYLERQTGALKESKAAIEAEKTSLDRTIATKQARLSQVQSKIKNLIARGFLGAHDVAGSSSP